MTRHQGWLMEMQPQLFVEMSVELGRLKGIENGERVRVTSPRGELEATAIVDPALPALQDRRGRGAPGGHAVALRLEFPKSGREESANLLTPSTGDPNTRIPETKAFMINIVKM